MIDMIQSARLVALSIGCLLAAAHALAAAEPAEVSANREKDYVAGKLIVFNDNGGWSWYQDERESLIPPQNDAGWFRFPQA